jgi:hypothetical protein
LLQQFCSKAGKIDGKFFNFKNRKCPEIKKNSGHFLI